MLAHRVTFHGRFSMQNRSKKLRHTQHTLFEEKESWHLPWKAARLRKYVQCRYSSHLGRALARQGGTFLWASSDFAEGIAVGGHFRGWKRVFGRSCVRNQARGVH